MGRRARQTVAALFLLGVWAAAAEGQVLRMGAVGASSGVGVSGNFSMRSLVGQASAGIPVNDRFRHGVGFWFADTEIKIPDAAEETEMLPPDVPTRFDLRQNYPNPFNPSTTIEYDLPIDVHVTIEIFNILGQRVALLVNEIQSAGSRKVVWDASRQGTGQAPSGIYIFRIVAGDYVQTRTMMLVK